MTIDILFDNLKDTHSIKRYGSGMAGKPLLAPSFYQRGMELRAGKVYILRTPDIPDVPREECLFICLGSAPTRVWGSWRGEVFYIAESGADIISVFNDVQDVFEKITMWQFRMQDLLNQDASIEAMLEASIPLFENRITIIDYELRMLAYCQCEVHEGVRTVRLSKDFLRVPNEKSSQFDHNDELIRKRDPYTYTEEIDGGTATSYCINLYVGDEYMGTCSLMEDFRPLRDSDYRLFRNFADYICEAITSKSRDSTSQFVTLHTIFLQLLQCFPVSRADLSRALEIKQRTQDIPRQWACVVVQSANSDKLLYEQYLCISIEEMLPGSTAVPFESTLAAFCPFYDRESPASSIADILEPYLKDMNFRAGMSTPFDDIFQARSYYLQARCALETGESIDPGLLFFPFSQYALPYMLEHSCGEFAPELVIPRGLIELKEHSESVDYWDTLRRYLDNECNGSLTAQEMYLHRSSLLPRIKKIKQYVDMDTPEQRLYLRMCIRLYDQLAGIGHSL